jgi:hypothetical protein
VTRQVNRVVGKVKLRGLYAGNFVRSGALAGSRSKFAPSGGHHPMRLWAVWALGARSAVKHRPADVVPQPLVIKYELANRLRELVTLPLALESPYGLALAFRRGST